MKTFLSPLTPEQEMECLKKMKDGDLEAKKELTLRNMRLVAHVAKKYQNSDEDMEDLILSLIHIFRKGIGYAEFCAEYADYRRIRADELYDVLDELCLLYTSRCV